MNYHTIPNMRTITLMLLTLFNVGWTSDGTTRVLFLPFNDKVKLNEAWDLSVDVPRWFSVTADTAGGREGRFQAISFDSSLALFAENKWSGKKAYEPEFIARLAARYRADVVVAGTVYRFKVSKRAIVTDGMISANHKLGGGTSGSGGATIMGGLQNYTASVRIDADIFNAAGKKTETLVMDSEAKDGGLKVWLPITMDNDQLTFYYLSRTPFGSVYFHKSVVGYLMRDFSRRLNDAIAGTRTVSAATSSSVAADSREFVEGKVLGRSGADVYINLGMDDNLFLGEIFEVLRPTMPMVAEAGDTLGWMEEPVAVVKIRSLKSSHFSQATIIEESVPVEQGWTVRLRLEGNAAATVDSIVSP